MKPGCQRGQASVEHVGLIAVVALAFVAILTVSDAPAPGLPASLARAILPGEMVDTEPRGAFLRHAHRNAPSEALAAEQVAVVEVVEELMAGDLDEFLASRTAPARDPRLDYSTDLCTAPVLGSSGPTYDFTEACLRHDFGYRNYGPLGLLDERRREVDERFLADMRGHCLTRPADQIISCLGWARTYYRAVRAFGWIPASKYD